MISPREWLNSRINVYTYISKISPPEQSVCKKKSAHLHMEKINLKTFYNRLKVFFFSKFSLIIFLSNIETALIFRKIPQYYCCFTSHPRRIPVSHLDFAPVYAQMHFPMKEPPRSRMYYVLLQNHDICLCLCCRSSWKFLSLAWLTDCNSEILQ